MRILNMKNPINKRNSRSILSLVGVCAASLILTLSSCNKDFPNTLRQQYPDDEKEAKGDERKVLYIILDGVRGQALSEINPTTLNLLARNSIYSYDGLVDSKSNTMTNAGAWANMTTGVDATKHMVTSEDFAGNDLTDYPTLFTRLKNLNSNWRTVSIAASSVFNDNLALDASEKQSLTSDVEVKNATISELKNKNAKIVVAQFKSADEAGSLGGYETSNTNYTQAINTLDSYVSEIMEALKSRENYKNENWLVIVASSKGGQVPPPPGGAGMGAFSDSNRNSFVIFHNPKFFRQVFAKPEITALPYVGYAPRFAANTANNAVSTLSNTTVGNFGSSGEFTLAFKMKHNAASPLYYPVFFAKRNPFNSVSSTGWGFLFGENGYQLDWGGSPRPGGGDIRDGIWHTIGFTITNVNGTRTLSLYTDGVKKSSNSIQGRNIDNTTTMRIGADIAGAGYQVTNFMLKDLVILNVGLSETDMAAFMRKEMLPSSPYFGNLIGWWPGNESTGNTINDLSGKGNPFTSNANVSLTSFEDLSPNVSPEISDASYRAVINNVDIPMQIYQWIGVPNTAQWSLDGRIWKIIYTSTRN